jgi:hypothetical protein
MTRAVMAREHVSRHLTAAADSTGDRIRIRDRSVLRYFSRAIHHLLHRPGTVR